MGIIGVMPLLSTLAALVIIVHSAEDEMSRFDRDYHDYDMTPEMPDTLDQRWRASRDDLLTSPAETTVQQSTPMDSWTNTPKQPKRRRLGRKRKRPLRIVTNERIQFEEPLQAPADNMHPQLPHFLDYDEQLQRTYIQYNQKPAATHKRRTPTREQRMTLLTTPRVQLAEFNDIFPGQTDPEPTDQHTYIYTSTEVNDNNIMFVFEEKIIKDDDKKEEIIKDDDKKEEIIKDDDKKEETIKDDDEKEANSDSPYLIQEKLGDSRISWKERNHKGLFRYDRATGDKPKGKRIRERSPAETYTDKLNEDRSLSEFSAEFTNPALYTDEKKVMQSQIANLKEVNNSRVRVVHREVDPIDPVALKDILKRSNGTSLSEILQQHNLSLSDLLKGKEDAIAVLKSEDLSEKQKDKRVEIVNTDDEKEALKDLRLSAQAKTENNFNGHAQENTDKEADLESQSTGRDKKQQGRSNVEENEKIPNRAPKRRVNERRKLRLRTSAMNGTRKNPLSRDLIVYTARKYYNNRNMTKSKEWKQVLPFMPSSDSSEEQNRINEGTKSPTTTTSAPEETTILHNSEYYSNPSSAVAIVIEDTQTTPAKSHYEEDTETETETETETTTEILTTEETTTMETITTKRPKVFRWKSPASRMGLRRQAYNNRMKRKRIKQKISTTEAPAEDFFGIPNLVSSSEFIAQTQTPKNGNKDNEENDFSTLDDFFTTVKPKMPESGQRYTRNSTIPSLEIEPKRGPMPLRFSSTTEETAKFEIEEMLNDTRTSARLSKILMERNMTLNELVEHRERGSSHVHLADIFHNASKEPNPPEPFLTKSSIEPISKETYPLRAILEANLHEAAPKANKIDVNNDQPHFVNIPIAMNFGNNVNENGENMGIMSLFNKLAQNDISSVENTSTGHDSEGTPYITTIFAVNNTEINDTTRESKAMKSEENNFNNDVVGWSHFFELMRRAQKNSSDENETLKDTLLETEAKELLDDSDGDGVIALEDLQRLKDFNINIGPANRMNLDERADIPLTGILDTQPSRTKSVTVATASIVGLALILFLITYAAFKWKQQRSMLNQKQNFSNEIIPTPVFENRKGQKINCSTRSISPMLNSNIYTMNTLDSSHGKESPDYMWDSLRRPFQ